MDENRSLTLVIRGENEQNIRDHLDFGPLVGPLTQPLEYWGVAGWNGQRVKIAFERTHEHEAVLAFILAGGGLVAAGFCQEFGKRLGTMLWDWLAKRVKRVRSENASSSPIKNAEQLTEAISAGKLANANDMTTVIYVDLT